MNNRYLLLSLPFALIHTTSVLAAVNLGYDVVTPADFGVSGYVYEVSESDFSLSVVWLKHQSMNGFIKVI